MVLRQRASNRAEYEARDDLFLNRGLWIRIRPGVPAVAVPDVDGEGLAPWLEGEIEAALDNEDEPDEDVEEEGARSRRHRGGGVARIGGGTGLRHGFKNSGPAN